MVAPTSGPYTRETSRLGPSITGQGQGHWYYQYRQWYRQRRPYNLPLNYQYICLEVLNASGTREPDCNLYAGGYDSVSYERAYNKAYAKLVSQLGDTSLWAVNIAEGKQSLAMIANRATQITRFCRALHRFDFPGASKALGLNRVPKGLKAKSKAFANNFLEYHFGWEPLVQDIGSAVTTLGGKRPNKTIKSSGIGYWKDTYGSSGSGLPGPYFVWNYKTSVRLHVTIQVANENTYMLQQLGFINPLSVAWELVPFSFVVDWFANVGQFLGSFSDFAGLTQINPYTSLLQVGLTTRYSVPPGTVFTQLYRSSRAARGQGITGPFLRIAPFKGLSAVRGLTAVSLLLQQMRL